MTASDTAIAPEPTADDILTGIDLTGRAAIVTGASSGVGVAIAAAPPVWAAVAEALNNRGGVYIEDCAIAPLWQPPTPSGWAVTAESLDPQQAKHLWDVGYPLIDVAGRKP